MGRLSWLIPLFTLLVVGLTATAALTASQGPSEVSVHYEPASPPEKQAFAEVFPVKRDHWTHTPAEQVQSWSGADGSLDRNNLPDALIPLPTTPKQARRVRLGYHAVEEVHVGCRHTRLALGNNLPGRASRFATTTTCRSGLR